MSEQQLIDASDVRQELWDWAEEIFASEPDNYKFNALIDIVDRTPTIKSPAPQWISIKDRLPEDRKNVLCLCKNNGMTVSRITFRCGNSVSFGQHRGVTHWMPLPESPKEETHEPIR